jgi:hypothetical protein
MRFRNIDAEIGRKIGCKNREVWQEIGVHVDKYKEK